MFLWIRKIMMKKNKIGLFLLVLFCATFPALLYCFTGEAAVWIRLVCGAAFLVFLERLLREG